MTSMPPLSSVNRFAALSVEEVYGSNSIPLTDTPADDLKDILTPSTPRNHCRRCPKWEKRLPECYIVALNPSSNSFELLISMQTLDTGEVLSTTAFLDSGATDLFVSSDFV